MMLTYRDSCSWDRNNTREAGVRQCPTNVPVVGASIIWDTQCSDYDGPDVVYNLRMTRH